MTLVEFLAPLKRSTQKEKVLAVLYFKKRYEGMHALTVDQVRAGLKAARVQRWSKINVADVLARCGEYVDSPRAVGTKRLWALTSTGDEHVRTKLGLPSAEPEIEHDVGSLAQTVAGVTDVTVRDYIEEAVKCLQVGALRAAVVFLWSGAVRTVQDELLKSGATTVNAALQKHDPRARRVTKIDHFAYIRDIVTVRAAHDVGLIDKNEKGALEEALNLRNRAGHPGKYRPGVKKVSAFIEDVTTIVFGA